MQVTFSAGFPRVGNSQALAGSENQTATFLIQKVVEMNALKPVGLTQPKIGAQIEKKLGIGMENQLYNRFRRMQESQRASIMKTGGLVDQLI